MSPIGSEADIRRARHSAPVSFFTCCRNRLRMMCGRSREPTKSLQTAMNAVSTFAENIGTAYERDYP
jgi:hypothetical protein